MSNAYYGFNVRTVHDLIKSASTDGGATHWLDTEQTTGYIVGATGFSFNFQGARLSQAALASMPMLRMLHDKSYDTLGSWVCGNKMYLDYGVHVADLEEAMALGRELGEKTIWDIERQREITL